MSKRDNGGPAFPSFDAPVFGGIPAPVGGMSLRDWFAGQALAGLVARGVSSADDASWAAYAAADAMIAAREASND